VKPARHKQSNSFLTALIERRVRRLDIYHACAILLIIIGVLLRTTGFDRGTSDYIAQPSSATDDYRAFYTFHPDEATIVRASLQPIHPLDPPFTAYGLLPVYVLRGALTLTGLEHVTAQDTEGMRSVYLMARFLAISLSTVCLVFTWLLGTRYFSAPAALIAIFVLSFAPGAIQQAHFYIVDGLFLAFALSSVVVGARAVKHVSMTGYAWTGLLIGATSACRLNGVLLGVMLVALDATQNGWHPMRIARSRHLWVAAATTVTTLLILQPYMVSNPLWFQQAFSHLDFGLSVQIANGSILQPWTLAYYHNTPYLDTWIKLLPLGLGWPFALLAPIALAYAGWYGPWVTRGILLWCSLQFLLVGSLYTQHVRYIVPFLPFIALSIGHVLTSLQRHIVGRLRQSAYVLVMSASLLYTGFYGVAFANIYTQEDSRITAARALQQIAPKGSRIGVENGGVSLSPLIDTARYSTHYLGLSDYFYTSSYMLCGGQLTMLQQKLQASEYIALVIENRSMQFTAVPSLFPVAADFYKQLLEEKLGFESVGQFKKYPNLLGFSFKDDDAEISFLAYEHPTVVLLKKNDRLFHTAIEQWMRVAVTDTNCADMDMLDISDHFKNGDFQQAASRSDALINRLPHAKIAYPLAAQAYLQLGNTEKYNALFESYQPIETQGKMQFLRGAQTRAYAPTWTAVTYTTLGHADLALHVLLNTKPEYFFDLPTSRASILAENYTTFALSFLKDRPADQEKVLQFILSIIPHESTLNSLASIEWKRKNKQEAISYWKKSLQLNPNQADVYQALGEATIELPGQRDAALFYLQKARQLNPTLQGE
jgi:tetratricopeptide (TPR) repeat protein